jgi:isoleucyl-tRNA synthetase
MGIGLIWKIRMTYKSKYMETVWWILKQIYNKDLMYKGYTIQPYSPKAGTGLSLK